MRAALSRRRLPTRAAHRVALALLLGVLLAGIADRPVASVAADQTVSVVDDDFQPGMITVRQGESVTWVNNGQKAHNVVGLRGEWSSGRLAPGEMFSFTFANAGTFPYQCTIHWSMAGTVAVEPAAGSSASASGVAAASAPAGSPTPQTPPRRYSPSFTIEGQVNNPRTITLDDLQGLPSEEITVGFLSGGELQRRTYRGVPLYDLLMAAGPQFDPDRRNDMLRWFVTVAATDDYEAVIAWGEIDPGFEAKRVLVAFEEDGQLLGEEDGMARLVVPGDQRGGRYVSNIVSISARPAGAP